MNKCIKMVFCLILGVVLVLVLCGCGLNKSHQDKVGNDYRMTVIYDDGWCVIYRDNETGVQYLSRPDAGTCVMVNADGTPYTGK